MSRGHDARRKAKQQQARVTAERASDLRSPRSRLVILVPAFAIIGTLAATTLLGVGAENGLSREKVRQEVNALLTGIPQRGTTLGSPQAPIELQMFADLECPTVGLFAEHYLPAFVNVWVRSGFVRLTYHPLQTDTGNERIFFKQEAAALAAGRQGKLWNFALTFLHEQRAQYINYGTDQFVVDIASQVPGLRMARWHRDRDDPSLFTHVANSMHLARSSDFESTPSFLIRVSTPKAARKSALVDGESAIQKFDLALRQAVASLGEEAFGDEPTVRAAVP